MKKILKRFFKIFLYSVMSVFAVIILALLSFWLELKSSVPLPTPTGNYEVGRTALHWIDTSRTDSLSPKPYSKRELIVWIWYPASITKSDSVVAYDRAEWEQPSTESPGFLSYFWGRDGAKIHPHSFQNPKLSDKQTKYPVIIMKSGIGTMAIDYTTYAEELASHGYIVIGSDAPYSTFAVAFPDGRIINRTSEGNPGEVASQSENGNYRLNRLVRIWSDDAHFVLNQLEHLNTVDSTSNFFGHLDLESVGIFGHSFGGATAAQFCLDDSRCKAGVDLDGAPFGTVIQKGIDKPFMFLLADHSGETDTISMKIKANINDIYNSFPDKHIYISLKGAQHFNFGDFPFQYEVLTSRLSHSTGSIGGRHGLEVASACLRTFFDEHLKGQSSILNMELQIKYPEIRFEK